MVEDGNSDVQLSKLIHSEQLGMLVVSGSGPEGEVWGTGEGLKNRLSPPYSRGGCNPRPTGDQQVNTRGVLRIASHTLSDPSHMVW